ncbi:hypothetical protein [Variovorax sp. DXTD-1]|uniref:hypothetical protein n=1 Tax=Variovorax sp. DXTD-1 TaxID=2495592 RepID=UPI000F8896DF|nr:hypothetical protein [Variovorax sp. DXTD-1]RST49584.1 hypothetical protein EJI00_14115 [Variovorax sp. DXTD-1]
MIKKFAILLIGACWAASAMSAPQSPVDKFVADKEFCAYMASLPENESGTFLTRYQAAMDAAISFVRKKNPGATDTQAIFSIKAKCDAALDGLAHYK